MANDDVSIEGLVQSCEQAGYGDIAVAMRDIEEAVGENHPDQDAVDEAIDSVVLPFHDEDYASAFTLGITFGAWLEQEYPDSEIEDDE